MPKIPLSLLSLLASAVMTFDGADNAFAKGLASTAPSSGSVENPVVVELFQSQGCSSCPPANAYLNAIADRPDVLALSFAVTYWDQLGWKDTFGSPRFTERQEDYARAGRGQVATPEFIINGAHAVVGSNKQAFDQTIAKAGSPSGGPAINVDGTAIRLATAKANGSSTVWLVRYDPQSRQVPIKAGENSGRTLPHRDIVRELVKLGDWTGSATSFQLPPAHEHDLASAVLVQRGSGGPIIAARRL